MNRIGYTLLELILVLAILAGIAAVALPAYRRSMEKADFRSGVISIQTILQQTRLESMKSGTTLIVRFQHGTPFYQVISKELLQQSINRDNTPTLTTLPGKKSSETDLTMTGQPFSEPVPGLRTASGLRFLGTYVTNMSTASATKPSGTGIDDEGNTSETSFAGSLTELPGQEKIDRMSAPIFFFPNGRTSQAIIHLESTGDNKWYAEIFLRGMTGTTRISAISIHPPAVSD